jgi:hypothetical protein
LKLRFSVRILVLTALAIAAGFGAVSQQAGTPVASADGFGRTEVTFTKWLIEPPNPAGLPWDMRGVVGGDIGNGTYAGEVLNVEPFAGGKIIKLTADYHLNGSLHTSNLRMTIWQFDNNFAILSGAVTSGWRSGGYAFGTYKVLATCPGNPAGPCFEGTLYIVGGTP